MEEGPIPAIHGVVRWRACDLIMRLYEEFGPAVSDDTIYRALKNLGFSHVSARPKAYKQNAEAMDAFKTKSFDDIVDHCCYAWNTLIDQPWKIMSIARRDWVAVSHSI